MASPTILHFNTFHSFSRLLPELRNEIWSLSLPTSRLVHVHAEHGIINVVPGRTPNQPFIHVSAKKLPVPAILHICSDSRAIGLNHYELVLDTNIRPAKEDFPHLHNIPAVRGNQRRHELLFPFKTKAMMYVDLERDYFVNSERETNNYWCDRSLPLEFRGSVWWTEAELKDPRFAAWPTQHWFQIEAFREAVPEKVFSRIRNFAASYHVSLNQCFSATFP